MIGRRVVAIVAVFGLGVLCCLGVVSGSAAAAPRRAPLVLHLKWWRVAQGGTVVATNDRYAVVVGGGGGVSDEITLIDEQTGTPLALSPPDCPAPGNEGPPMFGGPWLMFSCGPDAYQLYDLDSEQWVSFTPAPQCGYYSPGLNGTCIAVGVGTGWVKLVTSFGCESHCSDSYYLQNILSGELIPDTATPGGTTFDDLNSPSGSVPLCPPLHYPQSLSEVGPGLGTLRLSGPFALTSGVVYSPSDGAITVYHLERCGSHLNLTLPSVNLGGPQAAFLSSRAVVSLTSRQDQCKKRPFGLACTIHYYLSGVYLQGLRKFTAALPKNTVPKYASSGQVAGLTRQTIYVNAPGEQVWAATLPAAPASRHRR